MQRATAKEILWIKTIEEGDLRGEVFPFEERGRCTSAVVPETEIPTQPTRRETVSILSRRAAGAISHLITSHGQVASVPRCHLPWPIVIGGICLLAFTIGFTSDRIVNRDTINVISAPLLAILAWNFLAYLWNLAVQPLLGQRNAAGIRTLLGTAIGIGRSKIPPREERGRPPWGKLKGNFLARWTALVARCEFLTLSAALHLGAASLALGQVGGLYLGGLVRRYHAVWESTFLDRADFEKLAGFLFAPASWLTGIPVEITAQMEAGTEGTGVPADNWIHLCAATLVLLVALPRIVLTAVAGGRARSAWRAAAADLDLTGYANGLLRQIARSGMDVAVITCGPELPGGAQEQLTRGLQYAIGKPGSLRFLEGPAYGEEDDYPQKLGDTPPDIALIVFPLTTTPEEETQGLLAETVSRIVAATDPGGGRTVGILFADRFEEKFHDLPEFADRLKEREEAWSHVLAPRGVTTVTWSAKAPVSELGEALGSVLAARGT